MDVQFVNINGGGGSINLDCKYFLFNNYNGMNQLYTIPDNRIIITSDNPIKVLVQVNFGNFNGQTIGDMYLVYPDFLLGNKYKVKLPKSSDGTPGLISLMALDNGPTIRGSITQYKNGNVASVNQFILGVAVGERQTIFVSDSSDQDISYTIVANGEFVVVASVPCVDLSFASGNVASDSTSACDYSAFTLLPIQNYDCHSYLDGNATGGTSGLISLLAMDHGPDITGRFTKYVSGTAVLSTPFTLKTALGERQAIFVTDSSTSDISYLIEANNNFVVVAAVPCVDLQVAGNGFPSFSTSTCDYAAFTPLAIQDYACHSLLNGDGDIKGISSYSTNVIYELPNKVSCSSNLLVNNFQTNIVMSQDKVSVIMGKTIALNSGQFDAFASQSTFTQIRSTRLGGNRNPNFNFVTSAFLTNILDMSQAITGYVSFYNTVGGMTSLEVCGNNLNPNTFELNDQYIPNVYITQHILPNLHSYICYVIQVQPQGYNTFYSDAFYLAYISGSNDVNSQSSYGYALGFSASSLTSYYVPGYLNPGGDQNNEPTQAPPHAPTQAPSHAPTQTPPHAPPHAPTQGPPPTIASLSTTTPFPFVTTTKSSSQVQNTGLLIILSLAMFLMN
uniref:IgGFc_binding domain-containing protein n=1 Tax=Rhabditophanes sp. KR3021 TaxID=114890 RepID=A0AC35UDW1_9BILA